MDNTLTFFQQRNESGVSSRSETPLFHSRSCFITEMLRGKVLLNQTQGSEAKGLPVGIREPSQSVLRFQLPLKTWQIHHSLPYALGHTWQCSEGL